MLVIFSKTNFIPSLCKLSVLFFALKSKLTDLWHTSNEIFFLLEKTFSTKKISSPTFTWNFLPSLDVIDGEVSFCLDLNPNHKQPSLFDPRAWVYFNPFLPADVKYPTSRWERYRTALGPKWGPLGFTKWVDGQAYVRFKLGGLSKDMKLGSIETPEWECANTALIAGIIIGIITLFCLIPCCCIYYCHTRKVCKGCSRTCAWCSPCERYKQNQLAKKAAETSQPSTPALQSV